MQNSSAQEVNELSVIRDKPEMHSSGRLTGDVRFSGRLPVQSIEVRVPVAL